MSKLYVVWNTTNNTRLESFEDRDDAIHFINQYPIKSNDIINKLTIKETHKEVYSGKNN